jgi:hypothetical protein
MFACLCNARRGPQAFCGGAQKMFRTVATRMEAADIDVPGNFHDTPVEQWHADLEAVHYVHRIDLEEYALETETLVGDHRAV